MTAFDPEKHIDSVPPEDQGALYIHRWWPWQYVLVDFWQQGDGMCLGFIRQRRRWFLFGDLVTNGRAIAYRYDGKWCQKVGGCLVWRIGNRCLENAEAVARHYFKGRRDGMG